MSPFGISSNRNADVIVRLFRTHESDRVLVARQRVGVEQDGSYRARFARPRTGDCDVNVRITGTKERDSEPFPCYIPDFGQGTATLTSPPASETMIDALIADDSTERGYGLMYRPKMRADLGMAFLFESDTNTGFWMKNTLIPLSIAFFDSNGVIVRILDMEPCEEDPCESYNPGVTYRGALEVNQGAFQEWGISEGDRIEIDKGP